VRLAGTSFAMDLEVVEAIPEEEGLAGDYLITVKFNPPTKAPLEAEAPLRAEPGVPNRPSGSACKSASTEKSSDVVQ